MNGWDAIQTLENLDLEWPEDRRALDWALSVIDSAIGAELVDLHKEVDR